MDPQVKAGLVDRELAGTLDKEFDMAHADTTTDAHLDAAERAKPPKGITVEFNFTPLDLPKDEMTGAEIKAAAITYGLPVHPGFVLSVTKRNDKFEVVGDAATVKIRKGLSFTCVDSDDNS